MTKTEPTNSDTTPKITSSSKTTPSPEIITRVKKLRQLIDDYRYQYHVLDQSTMSEASADSLKHELSQLEATYPELLTPDSPTQRVAGQALDKFTKVAHRERMISLADVFNLQELTEWYHRNHKIIPDGNYQFFVDIKMDGLACALIYEHGKLTQAVTRGDGRVGEDVTANVRTIHSVPLTIPDNSARLEIRGEIIIFLDDFKRLNAERQRAGEPEFANPRNLSAGSIRQLDPSITASRPLRFIAYDIISDTIITNHNVYQQLTKLGFRTSNQQKTVATIDEAYQYIEHLESHRATLPFGTDGAVIKIDDRPLVRRLGIVGKTPRGAIAFKYPAEEATSIVRDIVISIGRTGATTPVAILDPVQIAGTTVKHASVHNADEIARLDLRIGDTVIIFKAGDIIPQIERVLTELRPDNTRAFDFQQALRAQYPELEFYRPDGEVAYRVRGSSPREILLRAVEYFASRTAMNIEGLGPRNVEALIEAGLLNSLDDLYRLRVADVAKLNRFGELSANNLINAIDAAKHPPLARFITALGIRHVGTQTAIDLANYFKSLEALMNTTETELLNIDGIGVVVAQSITAYFADADNIATLNAMTKFGVEPTYSDLSSAPLVGKSYVISGTLTDLSREDAESRIRELGGTATASVVKNTTALIAGENPGKSKLEKAQKLNIPILNEAEFQKLLS